MQGMQVIYKGRSIAKEGFRAFIYGLEGQKKLVNSWHEFESAMSSGIWFAAKHEAIQQNSSEEQKSEASRKRSR